MNKELATIGLAAIAVVLGLVALDSAPGLAVIAFVLAGLAVAGATAAAIIKAVRT